MLACTQAVLDDGWLNHHDAYVVVTVQQLKARVHLTVPLPKIAMVIYTIMCAQQP